MAGKARLVACPQCGKSVRWCEESRYRPFCSERCKMVDLGAWANEAYRIPVEEPPEPRDVDDENEIK
jgi:uncharacterized protein